MPMQNTSGIFNINNTKSIKMAALHLFILLSILVPALYVPPVFAETEADPALFLLQGKKCLDRGDYDKAITHLTAALEKIPLLGDYALIWRSAAYEGKGDNDSSLMDLKAIRVKYKDSPLSKRVRTKELSLLKKKNDPQLEKAYRDFVNDYPSDVGVKYQYAEYLKANNHIDSAKKIFREIYISASSYSKNALAALSSSDISAEDLLMRCENLKKAWLFEDAEKCFREVLQKDTGKRLNRDAMDGVAFSLFRQKKYLESAKVYKETKNRYWRARSVFRSGDFSAFDEELKELARNGDQRVAALMTAYAASKRRSGDTEGALKILNEAVSHYPSAREDALWGKGWTYYAAKDYKNAGEIFSQLYRTHGESKYLYWKGRTSELAGESEAANGSFQKIGSRYRDFYGYLSDIRKNKKPEPVTKSPLKVSMNSSVSERIDTLVKLGFTQEAVQELTHLSRRNPDNAMLIYISSYLERLGNYRASVTLISKVPYSAELHELYYPRAYWSDLEEASKENGIDPFLLLSVMREESRYDQEARSIAGALGLMQLMPQTAQRFNKHLKINLKHSTELYNARTNIFIGAYYLKLLVNRFGALPPAIAAYNAGEEAVKDWLKKGNYATIDEFIEDIPYDETRNYVKRVLTTYFEYLRLREDSDISSIYGSMGKL